MRNTKLTFGFKNSILSKILIFYIYIPYFINILENTFKIPSIYGYFLYLFLTFMVLVLTKRIKKNVIVFLLIFLLLLMINYLLVDYKYYVLIEGLQAFVCLLLPCICISSESFDLDDFIIKWNKFSYRNFFLIILGIILLKLKMVNYSIFTAICVPNVFIMSYELLQEKKKSKLLYINLVINILALSIFGGRMAAVVSVFMFLIAYFFSKNIMIWKKILLTIFLTVLLYFLLNNLIEILSWINNKLTLYNFYSRNITLLIDQLKNNELYLTNRNYIYDVCIEYIKSNKGLPGGFGVPLYITSGKYYYAHNMVLQFMTFFGLWGTIFIGEILTLRYKMIKKNLKPKYKKFLFYLVICYAVIGLTGSSIWIHYLSTMFIALFFFGNSKLYESGNLKKREYYDKNFK